MLGHPRINSKRCEVKQRLHKLLERVRRKLLARRPRSPLRLTDGASPLEGRTGWTVHSDVALRLKNLSVSDIGESMGDPGQEVGAFKIRLAGSPQVREDAGILVLTLPHVHQNVGNFLMNGGRDGKERVSSESAVHGGV
jgi:hypothetical protein